jgi:hypothetical protein
LGNAGFSLLEPMQGWRAEGMRDLPFGDYVRATGDERIGFAERTPFYEGTFGSPRMLGAVGSVRHPWAES